MKTANIFTCLSLLTLTLPAFGEELRLPSITKSVESIALGKAEHHFILAGATSEGRLARLSARIETKLNSDDFWSAESGCVLTASTYTLNSRGRINSKSEKLSYWRSRDPRKCQKAFDLLERMLTRDGSLVVKTEGQAITSFRSELESAE